MFKHVLQYMGDMPSSVIFNNFIQSILVSFCQHILFLGKEVESFTDISCSSSKTKKSN
jgi:hypothetical protein